MLLAEAEKCAEDDSEGRPESSDENTTPDVDPSQALAVKAEGGERQRIVLLLNNQQRKGGYDIK